MHKLKNDCGIWMDNQRDIAEKFISNYTPRFKASQVSNRDLLGVQVASSISHSDNIMLIKIPDMNEVKEALFYRCE